MSVSILGTGTVFVNSDRVVISLPGDWEGFPPGQPFTTFLLDAAGRTTRTLGWTDDPTAFLLRPSTNTNLLPPTRTGTALGTSIDPNVFTWIPPTEGAFDPFPSTPQSTTESSTPAGSTSTTSTSTSNSITPGITQPPASPTSTSVSDITAEAAPPSRGISTTVAISVGSGVGGIILIVIMIFFIRRRHRQKNKDAITPPPNIQEQKRHDLQRAIDEREASGARDQPAMESRAVEGAGGLEEDDLARSTSLLPPGQLQRLESHPSRRRVPSREDLPSPVNAALDPRAREHGILSPQPRPPSRPWRGILDEADYDVMCMTPGPLSVTEDYSTNAGEGSVDGYWLETASMREERFYRLQRPGHSPPPAPSQEPSRPTTSRPRPDPLVLAPQGPMSQIQEMSDVGMSPIRAEVSIEQAGPEGQAQLSSSPASGDATGDPTSSGMGSNQPLLKPQESPGQPSADRSGGEQSAEGQLPGSPPAGWL